jgi:tight adherence protein C
VRSLSWGALTVALVLAGAATVRPRPARPLRPPAPRQSAARPWGRGLTIGVAAIGLVVAPPLALLPPAAVWARRRTAAARRRRVEERAVATCLPDAVDLLLLCTSAGWSVPIAHPRVAARLPWPLGPALQAAVEGAERGRPRAEAIVDALTPLGDRARGLGDVLADHLRYGVPLLPGLERLGLEVRLDRRRRAELEARRVPVRLLAPLVLCTLPAFALLTVVPLLAASLRALPT